MDPETFHSTYPQLANWLDVLLEGHGMPQERTVLGGFSQGSVRSVLAALNLLFQPADPPRLAFEFRRRDRAKNSVIRSGQ